MAVAAFVVSVFAIVIAVVSVLYTRRQAISLQQVAEIEVERRKAERTPAFEGHIEGVNEGGWYRLVLRLTSAEPLSAVAVEITEGRGVSFGPSDRAGAARHREQRPLATPQAAARRSAAGVPGVRHTPAHRPQTASISRA